MEKFQVFARLAKVDVAKRQVWGLATSEAPDSAGEVMDYEHSRPHFVAWSANIQKATGGKSKGNLRAMHQPIAAGRIIDVEMRDAEKVIYIGAEVVDNNEWDKVLKGVYTGFSIGGKYGAWMQKEGAYKRYEAIPSEISLADIPCNPESTFEVVKADGTSELLKFATGDNMDKVFPPAKKDEAPADTKDEAPPEDKQAEQEAPANKDGQTPEQETDEHAEVIALLDDAIANGSPELKAMAEKIKAAIEADEAKEAQNEGAEDAQKSAVPSNAPAAGDAGGMAVQGSANRETIRAEVIALLEEVGLVQNTGGAMKAVMPEMVKVDDSLNKTVTNLVGDMAKLAASLDTIEERIKKSGGIGIVIRDMGAANSGEIAKMQEVEILKKALDAATDPSERQALQTRITVLEIKNVQTKK